MVAELFKLTEGIFMRFRIIFLLVGVLISLNISAQNKFSTQVYDKETGEGIEFANVNIYSLNPRQLQDTAITDEEGFATLIIPDSNKFPYEIEVVAMGYDLEKFKLRSFQSSIKIFVSKRFASLNEVVITGVPRPTKPQNAFSVYKTISAATIKSMGAVTLDQAVANQLNINTTNDGGILGSQTRMQGLSGDKVKILIDGMPVNGREAGNIDLSQLNLYNAEKIEIIQGPMSVVYGTDALGGVINMITKNNRKPWELNAATYYETVGKYNFNLNGTKSFKKHSFTLGGGRNYSDGWKYLDTISPRRFLLFKPKEQYVGNFNYSYNALSGFKIRFASDFVKEKITNKGVATVTPFEGYAFDDYYRNTRSLNRLLLDGKIKEARWQMMNGYSYYHRTKNTYRKDLVSLNQELSAGAMQDTTSFHEYSSRSMYNTKFSGLDLMLGYDVNIQKGLSGKIPGRTKQMNDYAAFATVGIPIIKEKLSTQLGLRGEHNSIYKAPLIPAINVLFHANNKMQVRGSYSKGFRAPTLKELYLEFIDQNHHVVGNTDLKAEKSDHIQASMSYQLVDKTENYAQLLITGYYNNLKNSIVLSPDDPNNFQSIDYTYRNMGKQKNAIGSLEIEGQQSSLHYKLGYSLTYVFKQEGEYSAFDAHEMVVNLQYFWESPKLNFSVFNKLTGSQPSLQTGIDGHATYEGRQPSYNMMDISLGRKFFRNRLQLTAGVKNVLDVQTLTPGGIAAAGIHSGNGRINFLPRSFFTSMNITLD